ncbi:hypothetical protein [uncultured Cyclobacterium sp.]|uniref:hypothetical protein n=1 Tax=uncultured Cyclobacterium sp. TaxID=453820 RepID=UPI0030ECEC18|tara:strand:+ start:1533 stop:2816 length:1284 start_codon:yes stop_codon:yes gene_type:complete
MNTKIFNKIKYIGTNLKASDDIRIIGPHGLIIGSNIKFGSNLLILSLGGVIINNNCCFGNNVEIHSCFICNINTKDPIEEIIDVFIPYNVVIEENVRIGNNVKIYPGVTIGKNTVISDNSIIKQNIKSNITFSPINLLLNENNFKFLNRKKTIDRSYDYKNLSNREISFVLSTGRCGSQSISSFLNQHPQITSLHEPLYQQLSVISTNFLSGLMNREEVKFELIKLYSNLPYYDKSKMYVESDQKIIPIADILLDIFPNSKFIWLIRNPKTFLLSARVRGWYFNDDPIFSNDSVLIVPKFISQGCRITAVNIQNMSESEWNSLSQDDKILWYWNYWNHSIKYFMEKVKKENCFIIKLENISIESNKILNFLNKNLDIDMAVKKTNQMRNNHLNFNKKISINCKLYKLKHLEMMYRNNEPNNISFIFN